MKVQEKRIEWVSDNGVWKIVGQVKKLQLDEGFPLRSINIFKLESGKRKHDLYPLGKFRKRVPSYVLEKYDEIHDEIRGRKDGVRI